MQTEVRISDEGITLTLAAERDTSSGRPRLWSIDVRSAAPIPDGHMTIDGVALRGLLTMLSRVDRIAEFE
jgi:hypothetical protein